MLLRLFELLVIFALSTFALFLTWSLRPELSSSSSSTAAQYKTKNYFPRTVDDLRSMAAYFGKYREKHFPYILLLFVLVYLYKQSFAIPGSFVLNILAGALFGRWKALLLVCPLTAVGASCCYLLSLCFAKPIVENFFSGRLRRLKLEVAENRYRLFSFLLCARLFPFTPHWLLNVCSPFVNIPLSKFALSIFIGLIPYNLLCVQAGSVLGDVNDFSEVFSLATTVQLTGLAILVFLFGKITKRRIVCISG